MPVFSFFSTAPLSPYGQQEPRLRQRDEGHQEAHSGPGNPHRLCLLELPQGYWPAREDLPARIAVRKSRLKAFNVGIISFFHVILMSNHQYWVFMPYNRLKWSIKKVVEKKKK